jgi:cytochrome c-type biogenesis protein CcmH/NrfG
VAPPPVSAHAHVPAVTAEPPSPAAAEAARPAEDVSASDDVAVSFFSTPPVTHPSLPGVEETATADAASERRRRLGSDTAVARRRDFARYVTAAVAVCVMICAAAAVRAATVSHGDREEASLQRTHYGSAHDASPAAAPPPAAEVIAPTAERAEAKGSETAAAPATETAPPTPNETATATPTPNETATPTPTEPATETAAAGGASPSPPSGEAVDARQSKKLAQRALDHGDATKAIEAARQSVEGDPSDAETWLILGGAYLQRGAAREARESFASCAKMATRGPRSECRALLR